MNPFDLTFLIVAGVLILWGAWKGLIKCLFQTLSWVMGILAMILAGLTFVSSPFWLPLLAGVIGFVLGFGATRIIGSVIEGLLEAIPLVGTVNHILGALLGLFKASILFLTIAWILHFPSALPIYTKLCVGSQFCGLIWPLYLQFRT